MRGEKDISLLILYSYVVHLPKLFPNSSAKTLDPRSTRDSQADIIKTRVCVVQAN